MDKFPIYDLKINETDDETGVYLVSFVDEPAIERDFVKLSSKKDEFKFKVTQEMKQYLSGPVLVPDMLIFRMSSQGVPYYVRFSADEIEKIVKKFFRGGFSKSTNQQHDLQLDGNYVFESWIVQDPETDKSKLMGFEDVPKGTWMMTYHVPDKAYWEAEILSGNVKGFSIEGFFDQIEVQMNKVLEDGEYKLADGSILFVEQDKVVDKWTLIDVIEFNKIKDKMKDKTLLGKIKNLIFKTNKMNFADYVLEDGSMIFVDDETKEAFKVAADGTKSVLEDGEYALNDGSKINVLGGLVVDAVVEEVAAAEAEVEAGEVIAKETQEQMSKLLDEISVLFDKQKSKIDILEEKLTKQGKSISKLEKAFEEFSKAPAAKEVNFAKTIEPAEAKKKGFIDFSKLEVNDKIKF